MPIIVLPMTPTTKTILDRGSSPLDWCEPNYTIHPYIAEFTNTISNVVFIILSLLYAYLFRDYARKVNGWVNVVWSLLAIVGLCSAYFHATLSLLGQMLDELSILWVMSATFALWTPRRVYPSVFGGSRVAYQKTVFLLTILMTILAWMYPVINAYFLALLGVLIICITMFERKKCHDIRVRRLTIWSVIAWIFSMTCWLCDRLLCQSLRANLGLVYLHAVFHVSIAYTTFTMCALYAYFDAVNEYADRPVVMQFWPMKDSPLGVPYVAVK